MSREYLRAFRDYRRALYWLIDHQGSPVTEFHVRWMTKRAKDFDEVDQ
jgi:hypothetical protein